MTTKKTKVQISNGEMELLRILWDVGGATISQVHKELASRGKNLAYGTVQTRLNRLVDNRTAKRVGFPGEYHALLKPEDVSESYYDNIEKLCGGCIVPLLSHLASKRDFDAEEIAFLEEIVQKHKESNNE
ncbi:MAG: BlaI/MecI/CopY family transcriptional regulator [Thermoguttaceae bacterium]